MRGLSLLTNRPLYKIHIKFMVSFLTERTCFHLFITQDTEHCRVILNNNPKIFKNMLLTERIPFCLIFVLIFCYLILLCCFYYYYLELIFVSPVFFVILPVILKMFCFHQDN